jgi:hypothetical protein
MAVETDRWRSNADHSTEYCHPGIGFYYIGVLVSLGLNGLWNWEAHHNENCSPLSCVTRLFVLCLTLPNNCTHVFGRNDRMYLLTLFSVLCRRRCFSSYSRW